MLSPSTAPRWKMATRTFRRPVEASAARNRNRGGAASATSVQAPALTNVRRVIMALLDSFHRRRSVALALLELRRSEDERQELFGVGVGRAPIIGGEPGDFRGVELRGEDRAGLGGDVAVEDRGD